MREIKFRGYCKDEMVGSQWITDGYGVTKIEYVNGKSDVYLLTPYGDYLVHEDSVGQYIGMKDINGVEIYEGDILEYTFEGETKSDVIVYKGNMFTYKGCVRWNLQDDKIIGNIYESKDLLR